MFRSKFSPLFINVVEIESPSPGRRTEGKLYVTCEIMVKKWPISAVTRRQGVSLSTMYGRTFSQPVRNLYSLSKKVVYKGKMWS